MSRLFWLVLLAAVAPMGGPAWAQWARQESNIGAAGVGIQDLSLVNPNVAWATSNNVAAPLTSNTSLTRTTNGGTTWARRTVNNTLAAGLLFANISAVDANNAWVAMFRDNGSGSNTLGRIFRTTDGGATWTHQSTAAFAAPAGFANGVHMYSLTAGVTVGDPNGGYFEIYTTANGGTSWGRVPSASIPAALALESGVANTLVGLGTQAAWFGTSAGRVFRSTTGGSAWQASATGLSKVDKLTFADANNGLALDRNLTTGAVRLARTTNGGLTWTVQAAPTGRCYASGLSAVPGTPGAYVSVGAGPTLAETGSSYSYDNGLTWTQLDFRVEHAAVAFLDAQTGYAGGTTLPGFLAGSYFGGIYRGALPGPAAPPLYCTTGLGGNTCAITELQVVGTTLHTSERRCPNFSEPDIYSLFADEAGSSATLTPGSAYPVRLRTANDAAQVGAWLDSNRNNVFEASEYTLLVASTVAGELSPAASVAVPAGAVTGPTRLRVRLRTQGSLAAGEACAYFADGETRDYPVTIGPAIPVAAPPAWVWARAENALTLNTLNANAGAGQHLVADPATGATFVSGTITTAATFSNGTFVSPRGADAYVAKYNAQGVLQWVRLLGGTGADSGQGLAADGAGGVYAVGSYSGTGTFGSFSLTSTGGTDLFVARLDAAGTVTSARGGGGTDDDRALAVAMNATGLVVTGYFTGSATFGTTTLTVSNGFPSLPFVLRYDAAGTLQWAQAVVESGLATTAALDAAGNAFVGIDGVGSSALLSYGPTGTVRWNNPISYGFYSSKLNGLKHDGAGNLYVVGTSTGGIAYTGLVGRQSSTGTGAYLLKVNAATGAGTWLQLVPDRDGFGYSNGTDLALAANGDILITGTFNGTVVFNTDVLVDVTTQGPNSYATFVAKYNPAGQPQWGQQSVGSEAVQGLARATAIGLDAAGNAYVRGWFNGTVSFGTTTLNRSSGTSQTFFVAKLGPGCDLPAVDAGPDVSACPGSTVALGGSAALPGLTYNWTVTPALAGFASTAAQTTATLPAAGGPYTFTLTVAGNSSCPASDRVVVTVEPLPAAPFAQPAARCGAGALTLQAGGAPAGGSYRWYAQAAGGTVEATTDTFTTPSLTATTTYYVSAVSASGCEGPRTAVVATLDVPPVAALQAGGPTSFCPGGSVVLTATGGTAGLSQYQFQVGGQPVGAASATPTLTVTAAGSYTVVVSNPQTGCAATSAPLVVALSPVPVAQPGAAATGCAGTPVQLGSAPTTGYTYQWSPATGLSSATASNPTVTLSTAGTTTYALTVTNAQGCTATATVAVTITPAAVATAGPARTVCSGGTASLGGSALAGYTYQWSPATGLSSATISNPTVTLANPGAQPVSQTYTVTATNATGCTSTATVTVTVNPAPAVPVIVRNGNTLTSSAPTGNQWYFNGQPIVGATGVAFTATSAGTYTVVVTDANGCGSSTSVPVVVTASRSGAAAATISLFPNPTRDGLLTLQLTGLVGPVQVSVLNALGQVVRQLPAARAGQPVPVDCSHLPSGMYLLQVQTAAGALSRPFLRE